MSKFQPVLDNTSYLFSNNYVYYLQSQIDTIGACYIMYARGMQSSASSPRFKIGGSVPSLELEWTSWAVPPRLCVWAWSLERVVRACEPAGIVHHWADTLCCCYRLCPRWSWKLGEMPNWPLSWSSRLMIWFCCYQPGMDHYWGTVHACI